MIGLVAGPGLADLEPGRLRAVILQVAADAGPVQQRREAERLQDIVRPDAGQGEDARRPDGTGGQDHFAARPHFGGVLPAPEPHPAGPPVLDHDTLHQDVRQKPQVGAMQHRFQEAARRGPATPSLLVDVKIAGALVVAAVEVGDRGNAEFARCGPDGIEHRPGDARRLDPPAAPRTVVLAVAEEMILEPPEARQHLAPTPTGKARRLPAVVVGRLSPHADHRVDGRRTADHLAARIGERAAVEARLGLGAEHPIGARVADGEKIADRDVVPDPVVPPAGFEQQHAAPRIGRQAIGQDAAGRPGPHDHVVVVSFETLHGVSSRNRRAVAAALQCVAHHRASRGHEEPAAVSTPKGPPVEGRPFGFGATAGWRYPGPSLMPNSRHGLSGRHHAPSDWKRSPCLELGSS